MATLNIDKSQIPLWHGANGSLILNVDGDAAAPLSPGAKPVIDARFNVAGTDALVFGTAGTLQIAVQPAAHLLIAPLFREDVSAAAALAKTYDLGPFLTADNLLLTLDLGGDAALTGEGTFRYSALTVDATLRSGTDATLVAVRAFPRSANLLAMISDLLAHLATPDQVTTPPSPGELIAFEYGGYLNFGAGVSAGYEMKGTHSFRVSEIALSEHYAPSIIGRLAVTAGVAGRFSIEVRAGSAPGWARVVVRRRRSSEMQVAADVKANATIDTVGLPKSGREFLGALLGVQAKNWLNLIDGFVTKAGEVDSAEVLKTKLDGLADDFVSMWVGESVDALAPEGLKAVQARIAQVVESYRTLDNAAITLFDRYFDPLQNRVDQQVVTQLETLAALPSWSALQGEVDPMLWNVVQQLTGGDPLGWALGLIPGTDVSSLDALHARASQTLSLVRDAGHEEIRRVIALAKERFAIDQLIGQLDAISTPEGLKAVASQQVGHFVERLIGASIDSLKGDDLKKAFEVVQAVAHARDRFFDEFDKILVEAASQAFKLGVHEAYVSAAEGGALVDVEIKLCEADGSPNPAGQRLMRAAGRGDFQEILAHYQPAVVKLLDGVLTHRLSRTGLLQFNVAGWHKAFKYQAVHRVIVDTRQQIRATDKGLLTVFTNVDMTLTSERRANRASKSEQAVLTNFLLRFVAESKDDGAESSFDAKTRLYALDVITSMAARYRVNFTGSDTALAELEDCLRFAKTLGLDRGGATLAGVLPVLQRQNGGFGKIDVAYDVRYSERGVRNLVKAPVNAPDVRHLLRAIVLANYFSHPTLRDVGWLYGSDDVRRLYDDNSNAFVASESALGAATVRLTSAVAGIQPPQHFTNTAIVRNDVATLFRIEDKVIKAFAALGRLLRTSGPINTATLDSTLDDFGQALEAFDDFDNGDNSVFAVFDGLVLLATPADEARSSSLTLTATVQGADRTLVFARQANA